MINISECKYRYHCYIFFIFPVGVASAKLASPSGGEDDTSEDHAPVPTFQSAFSEALARSWGEMRATTCNHQQLSDQSMYSSHMQYMGI